jgi:hypothetical protein
LKIAARTDASAAIRAVAFSELYFYLGFES